MKELVRLIESFENPKEWNQNDRFIQGKISGLKQALRILTKNGSDYETGFNDGYKKALENENLQ